MQHTEVQGMSYSQFIEAIRHASAFDLFRLRAAIDIEIESPQKIAAIKSQLKVGQETTYFDTIKNRCVPCTVIALNVKRVAVVDHEVKRNWSLPYYMVNVASDDASIVFSQSKKLTRNQVSIGDIIGFKNKDGHECYGRIIRINTKTASVVTTNDQKWRVGYGALFKVVDADVSTALKEIGN